MFVSLILVINNVLLWGFPPFYSLSFKKKAFITHTFPAHIRAKSHKFLACYKRKWSGSERLHTSKSRSQSSLILLSRNVQYIPIFASLSIIIIVIITYNRNEPLEPRQLVEVLHGVDIGIRATWRRWARVVVAQAETSSKEPLN